MSNDVYIGQLVDVQDGPFEMTILNSEPHLSTIRHYLYHAKKKKMVENEAGRWKIIRWALNDDVLHLTFRTFATIEVYDAQTERRGRKQGYKVKGRYRHPVTKALRRTSRWFPEAFFEKNFRSYL